MKLKNKIASALTLTKVRFLKQRIPLAIRWQLTNKCPSRCLYCNLWETPSKEMTTEQIFSVLDELAEMGTKRISFSGGEPTLRDDLGKIIDYTKSKGISPSINTNGFRVPEIIDQLKNLDLIKISLDGSREANNKVRGHKNAFYWATSAAEAADQTGIKFTFCSTLTKYNLKSLDFMVNLAKKYNTMVAFQPLKTIYRGVKNMDHLYPTPEEWKEAIKKLRKLKETYTKNIRNSNLLLDHIDHWPKYKKIQCWAGKIFCIIDTNGNLVPCDRVDFATDKIPNVLKLGFKKAFEKMPAVKCSGCGFCGSMELNFLLKGRLTVLSELTNLLK